jgi:cell division protein FtsI/penicillin-binding protein 2
MRSSALLFSAVAALLIAGAGRLAYIETARGDGLRAQADSQQTASIQIPARRGDILDTRGRVLAGSMEVASIYVDVTQVPDIRFGAYSVAPILGLDPARLERELNQRERDGFVWIKRGVSDEELSAFLTVRQARRLTGFAVQREAVREYPAGRMATHVLGFVGAEHYGLAGVEQAYDAVLRGTPGERTAIVDARRRRLRAREDRYAPPHDGAGVVLTLDSYVQQTTEKHLAAAVQKFEAEWATAVVFDPQSGEVLAMATHPDFDPAQPIPPGIKPEQEEAARERLRNRAISDSFEPGSVFKPFILSCALDERVVRLDEVFNIAGPVRKFGSRTINDTHAYSSLAAHEIISKSSNIGMGLVGERLRNERLHRYVRMFGFGDMTGIGLPGEHAGLVNDFVNWTSFSTQSIPIGQEIAVTPIQIATAFSVFCNGGILYRPRIVRGIIGPDGELLEDHSRPIPIRRVLSEETTRRFRLEALVETVTSGTGKSARTLDWQVFGKTGTAQIARPGGHGYLPGKYVGSFVGGAPSDDPRAVCVVSIYKPSKGGYYGGVVAAPTVGAILGDTLQYLQVPKQLSGAANPRAGGLDVRD